MSESLILHANLDTMKTVMREPFESFMAMGQVHHGKTSWRTPNARHIFIDRGASVLGVAHLDSVCDYEGFWANRDYICSPTIDNRMGAWLMLYGLPSLGVEMDVLLTENEERGSSTAGDFTPDKEYNWAFSFDRSGTDVACYQYYDDSLDNLLAAYQLEATYGSYSDVADLDLGVKCMNFGVGMYDYHSPYSYVRVAELALQIKRFLAFYAEQRDAKLIHSGPRSLWEMYDDSYWYAGTSYTKPYQSYEGEWVEGSGYSLAYPIALKPRLDIIDNYLARQAVEEPMRFFEDTNDPTDWHYNHSMGDLNQMDVDDPGADAYFAGYTHMCDRCEHLFAQGDLDKYVSLDERLCKACFHEWASHYFQQR